MKLFPIVSKCIKFTNLNKRPFSSGKQISIVLANEFLFHKINQGPETTVTLSQQNAMNYFKEMFTIRRIENAANVLYKEKKIRGFCHLYSGQEAICVGMKSAMKEDDRVITAYRVHGWAYSCGLKIEEILGELLGRETGCSKGKGGSMHLYGNQLLGGNGIVGAQVPIGTGVALAMKTQKKDAVCITLYGDGAANQGQVFEAYNMAKLWNIPCIFVCENNGYGMGTSANRAAASTDYFSRGDYIPGIKVDGMDIMAVRQATDFARNWCTTRNGPIILEMATYRYHGHSMSDPGTSYRTRDEVQTMRKTRDPIIMFKNLLIEHDMFSKEELDQVEKDIKQNVDSVVKVARKHALPKEKELYTDIYKDESIMYPVRLNDSFSYVSL